MFFWYLSNYGIQITTSNPGLTVFSSQLYYRGYKESASGISSVIFNAWTEHIHIDFDMFSRGCQGNIARHPLIS